MMLVPSATVGTFGRLLPSSIQILIWQKHELPDGFRAKGWSNQNELLVEKWEPYYYRQKLGDLKTGDTFNGVTVNLIEPGGHKAEK
jgi:hypothetical protein